MPTEFQIYDDILLDPADDVVRRVYADFLDDQGMGRMADHIRQQLDQPGAIFPQPSCNPHERYLLFTEQLDKSKISWDRWAWEYRRGFVARVALPWRDFMEHAAMLFQLQPIEEIHLLDRRAKLSPPATSPDGVILDAVWKNGDGMHADRPELKSSFTKKAWFDSVKTWLPYELWELLDGQVDPPSDALLNVHKKFYPTTELADAAASRACVLHGRRAAGLIQTPALEAI